MGGVGAEGLVVGALAVVADVGEVGEGALRAAVVGGVAVEVSGARLRFVVHREVPDGLRLDRQPAFGETLRAAVEAVDGPAHGAASSPRVLAVVVPQLVHGVGDVFAPAAEEVVEDVGVREVLGLQAECVALGEIGLVLDVDAVAVAVNRAAPVAVVVLVVGPVVLVAVIVLVPCAPSIDLAVSEVLEVPADGLPEGEAVLRAVVEVGGSAESEFVRVALVYDVVHVAGQDVSAPARGVAREEAPAVVGVEGIVPEGDPEDGDVVPVRPHVAQLEGAVDDLPLQVGVAGVLVRERAGGEPVRRGLAGEPPVEMVRVVGAGGHHRVGAEVDEAQLVAADVLAEESVHARDGAHASGGRQLARLAVGGHVSARELQLA